MATDKKEKKEKKTNKLNLAPPWVSHVSMLEAFFDGDPRFAFEYEGEVAGKKSAVRAKVLVNDADTAIALGQVLATKVKLGNVTLELVVTPANEAVLASVNKKLKLNKKFTDVAALKKVLEANPKFDKLVSRPFMDTRRTFCVFKPVVIQWSADNIGSPWKLISDCMEYVADSVFKNELGVLFCTAPAVM